MKTILIAVTLSALTAFAAATWVYSPAREQEPETPGASFDANLPTDARIAALEQAVSQERMARQLLQEEVLYLTEELNSLATASDPESGGLLEESREPPPDLMPESRRERFARRSSPEGRVELLIEAGIEPGTASWIIQREEELQMESLQARFEAGQSGSPFDFYRDQMSASDALREEIGDADFERYLEANGRPTNVSISSVIGNSPAQAAGLRPGDEITRYGGERVFSMTDINMASLDGMAGENVVLDIVRDGMPMQVVIPRGPLGISAGRRQR